MNTAFQRLFHLGAVVVPLIAFAFCPNASGSRVDLPGLPPPAFADLEVSTNVSLAAPGGGGRWLSVSLSFAASASNAVSVAFGRDDAPADGVLSAAETRLAVGWDCGEWFAECPALTNRITVVAKSARPTRDLVFRLAIGSDGEAKGLCVEEGGASVFAAPDPLPVPEAGAWDTLRLTARGPEGRVGAISATSTRFGTRLEVR